MPETRTPSVEEVNDQICSFLRAIAEIEGKVLGPETTFVSLALTSLQVMTLVFDLEDHYGIAIKDNYLDDFRTVGQASATVLALLAKRPA